MTALRPWGQVQVTISSWAGPSISQEANPQDPGERCLFRTGHLCLVIVSSPVLRDDPGTPGLGQTPSQTPPSSGEPAPGQPAAPRLSHTGSPAFAEAAL